MSDTLGPEHSRLRDEIIKQIRDHFAEDAKAQKYLDGITPVSSQDVIGYIEKLNSPDALVFRPRMSETSAELAERIKKYYSPSPIVEGGIQDGEEPA